MALNLFLSAGSNYQSYLNVTMMQTLFRVTNNFQMDNNNQLAII